MGLNLKNEETYRLVKELSVLTGETMTAAVTNAVREKLERSRKPKNEGMAEKLIAIAHSLAPFREGKPAPDHGELLYGGDGLPR